MRGGGRGGGRAGEGGGGGMREDEGRGHPDGEVQQQRARGTARSWEGKLMGGGGRGEGAIAW